MIKQDKINELVNSLEKIDHDVLLERVKGLLADNLTEFSNQDIDYIYKIIIEENEE